MTKVELSERARRLREGMRAEETVSVCEKRYVRNLKDSEDRERETGRYKGRLKPERGIGEGKRRIIRLEGKAGGSVT